MSHHYLRFSDVQFAYPNQKPAIDNISFCLPHGCKCALLGANGAGKSTMLLLVDGFLTPQKGQIDIGGIPLTKKTLPEIRRTVGFVFQNADDQLFMPSVEEDVAFGAVNMGLDADQVERRTVEALEKVGALHLRHRSPSHLSGGEKKRVAIATVLAMEPSVLIMDEPSAGLDPLSRRELIELIDHFDHTCLIATHDMELAKQLCDRALVLDHGKLAADGSTTELLTDYELMRRCSLM